ncbi:molybdopterin molybdotransferase MoeA [Methylobacterium sp. A54F]
MNTRRGPALQRPPTVAARPTDLTEIAEAHARMRGVLGAVGIERVALDEAAGRICAETIAARLDAPPFAVAAMDGYALRWADAETPLRCLGMARAGDGVGAAVEPGTCRRIFTGAPVPPGADTVVAQERVVVEGDRVHIGPDAEARRHIRAAGSNFREGAPLVRPGTLLSARHIGLLAAAGHAELRVHRRPRVAILSTGSELSDAFAPSGSAQVLDANRPALKALVRSWGGVPLDLGIAPDEAAALSGALARTLAAQDIDLLVASGGASVGDFDLVGPALTALGLVPAFSRVRMRPGKATLFGRVGRLPVLGLPGNAVAALVSALVFLRPTLSVLAGCGFSDLVREDAILSAPLGPVGARVTYLRGRIERASTGLPTFAAFPEQDTAMLSGLAEANALVEREPDAPALVPGAPVRVIALGCIPGF